MDLTIAFHADVDAAFEKLRQKKTLYAIFKTNDDKTELLVDTESKPLETEGEDESAPTFEDFKQAMPKDEPRWAIYYLHL